MTTSRPSNADIMKELGALAEAVRNVREELGKGHKSREKLFDALSEVDRAMIETNKAVSELAFKVDMTAQVASLARDEVKAMYQNWGPITELKDDLVKMVNGWKDVNRVSKKAVWIFTLGGGGIVALLLLFLDTVRVMVARWLMGGA